jgi:hypothetical protein
LRDFLSLAILPQSQRTRRFVVHGIHLRRARVFGAVAAVVAAVPLAAQQPAQPAPQQVTPEVGSMAPDFSIPGATRYGVLKTPIRLSDLRGQTVVLAFFVQARTRG